MMIFPVGRILDAVVAVAVREHGQAGAVKVDAIVMSRYGSWSGFTPLALKPNLPLLFVNLLNAADDTLALW